MPSTKHRVLGFLGALLPTNKMENQRLSCSHWYLPKTEGPRTLQKHFGASPRTAQCQLSHCLAMVLVSHHLRVLGKVQLLFRCQNGVKHQKVEEKICGSFRVFHGSLLKSYGRMPLFEKSMGSSFCHSVKHGSIYYGPNKLQLPRKKKSNFGPVRSAQLESSVVTKSQGCSAKEARRTWICQKKSQRQVSDEDGFKNHVEQ